VMAAIIASRAAIERLRSRSASRSGVTNRCENEPVA
jgi:hypothetical protein